MDRNQGVTGPSRLGMVVAGAALALLAACSDREAREARETNYCPPRLGCANKALMAAVDARCPTRDKACSLSLEDVFGDLDRVYFVDWPARLDECTTIPVPDALKRSHEPLCQYVLLEKGGRITHHLRGGCMEDVRARDDLRFGTSNDMGFVLAMDPGAPVRVTWSADGDEPAGDGGGTRSYFVEPSRRALVKVDADKEPCARSP